MCTCATAALAEEQPPDWPSDQVEDPGPVEREQPHPAAARIPQAFAQRELITAHHRYDVHFGVPLRAPGDGRYYLGLELGAKHGILEDCEVGVFLWSFSFDKTSKPGSPGLHASYRYLQSAFLEAAVHGRLAFPLISEEWAVEAALPLLLRAGPWLRLDTGPRYAATSVPTDLRPAHRFSWPASLTVQLGAPLRLTALFRSEWSRTRSLRLGAGGEVALALADEKGEADFEVGVSFELPALYAERPPPLPRTEWVALLGLRLYFVEEADRLGGGL